MITHSKMPFLKSITKNIIVFLILFFNSSTVYASERNEDMKSMLLKMFSSVGMQETADSEQQYLPRSPLGEDLLQPAGAEGANYVQTYFPLNNYDTKHYQGDVLGTTYYATYTYSRVYFNSVTCFRENDSLDGSRAYYGYSGTDLKMYGASVDGESFPFDTPLTVLNDSMLNNGGSLQSSTSLTVEGYPVTVDVTVVSSKVGTVSIPLGSMGNCRSIAMNFTFRISGEQDTLDMKEVWILAPNIGKYRIALVDQYLIQRGWMDLTGGTVGGQRVIDIVTPLIADFEADTLEGFSPLTVRFTDLSSGAVNAWHWDFGDGTSSSSPNPEHVFQTPGNYNVSLTVTGPNGSDTETKEEYIRVKQKRHLPFLNLLLGD